MHKWTEAYIFFFIGSPLLVHFFLMYYGLPQLGIRLSVPSLTNQVIQNLKDTSVAFLIQYHDLFAQIQEIASSNFHFFKAYMTAAVVYLALVSIIVVAARRFERFISLPGFETH